MASGRPAQRRAGVGKAMVRNKSMVTGMEAGSFSTPSHGSRGALGGMPFMRTQLDPRPLAFRPLPFDPEASSRSPPALILARAVGFLAYFLERLKARSALPFLASPPFCLYRTCGVIWGFLCEPGGCGRSSRVKAALYPNRGTAGSLV